MKTIVITLALLASSWVFAPADARPQWEATRMGTLNSSALCRGHARVSLALEPVSVQDHSRVRFLIEHARSRELWHVRLIVRKGPARTPSEVEIEMPLYANGRGRLAGKMHLTWNERTRIRLVAKAAPGNTCRLHLAGSLD